jgi:tRNA 2-selenouridine synthase
MKFLKNEGREAVMIYEIEVGEFLQQSEKMPVADVRSPIEYEKGHLPSASNLYLFDNDERALLGLLYTKRSPEDAIHHGKTLAEGRLQQYIAQALSVAPAKTLCVYCWRGGMRSHSFAELLSREGFTVFLLKGGYKEYRNYVLRSFETRRKLLVVGGMTGSGKTELLQLLQEEGFQMVDLESLARHRGSVFGAIHGEAQPCQQQFENELFSCLRKFNPEHLILVEDENYDIGNVRLPYAFWQQIREAPMLRLDIPVEIRLAKLVNAYATGNDELLLKAAKRLEKRLGRETEQSVEKLIATHDYHAAAAILLDYYDQSYEAAIRKRPASAVIPFATDGNFSIQERKRIREILNNLSVSLFSS